MSVAKAGSVHVALLRGINVGGKNKLPMADLRVVFEDAACADVRTYIQSGNVTFRAKAGLAERIPGLVTQAIADRFGYQIPVVMRSAAELRKIVRGNPFLEDGADEKTLHVAFLADKPKQADVIGLDADRSPPAEFRVHQREIYLRCPNGLARSNLTNRYFDSKLNTTSTLRNWKTVLHLVQMANA